jgi:hypothetical protein
MKITNLPNEFDNLHMGEVLIPNHSRLMTGKSVLQCGARPGDGWIKVFKCFSRNGYDRFHILEIHKPNVQWLRTQKAFHIPCVVHGDIRKIDTYDKLDAKYDVVIFWHGWEHCTYKETKLALPKVMSKCRIAHIAGMPWGKWNQGEIKGNPHEKHVHHWYPEQLEKLGFDECFTFNASSKGKGADHENVMYAVKYV